MKRLLSRILARCSDINGETLVETLTSTLIIAGVMLMLCTAIVSAARVNATIQNEDTVFEKKATDTAIPGTSFTVAVNHSGTTTYVPVNAYKSENGYIYYEPSSSN